MDVPRQLIDDFITLTHAEPAIASQLLGDNGLDLEAAIASYFAIQDAQGGASGIEVPVNQPALAPTENLRSSSNPTGASRDDDVVVIDDDDEQPRSTSAAAAIAADEAFARRLAGDDNESEIRAPLPDRVEQILPTQHSQGRSRVRRAASIADPFLQSDGTPHGNLLAELFQPPTEMNFNDQFDAAMRLGQGQKKWILVNIQRSDLFSCHVLNRDIWADPAVRDLIQVRFVFWQRDEESEDGAQYKRFYSYGMPPHIAIIDPRSGERIRVWGGDGNAIDKNSFLSSVVDFCDSHSLDNFQAPPRRPTSRNLSSRNPATSTTASSVPNSVEHIDLDSDVADTEEAQVAAAIAASMSDVGRLSAESLDPTSNAVEENDIDINDGPSVTYVHSPMELERQTSRLMSATDPELNVDRSLRAQQDSEYEESLALDRAKAESEKVEQARAERAASHLEEKRGRIPDAPPEVCDQPTTELLIRLPSGKRVQRRFFASNTIGNVYDFVDVECVDELGEDSYNLVVPFPRRSFLDRSITLAEADLSNKAVIVVDKH